jgi:hypothetical protein
MLLAADPTELVGCLAEANSSTLGLASDLGVAGTPAGSSVGVASEPSL